MKKIPIKENFLRVYFGFFFKKKLTNKLKLISKKKVVAHQKFLVFVLSFLEKKSF